MKESINEVISLTFNIHNTQIPDPRISLLYKVNKDKKTNQF